MDRLLTEEEIKQSQVDIRPGGEWVGDCTWREKAVAKAQDAKSIKLRDKEWIEEIESYVAGNYPYGDTILIDKEDWQTLKSKMEKDYGRFK